MFRNHVGGGFYKPLGIYCWTQLWNDQSFDRASYFVSSNLYFCPQDRVCWQILGIELLSSVSSETLVWCFYKVLVKLISHRDFLIHSFNTWTFTIVLWHQKSNPFKVSGESLSQLLWKPWKRTNSQTCLKNSTGGLSNHWRNIQTTSFNRLKVSLLSYIFTSADPLRIFALILVSNFKF